MAIVVKDEDQRLIKAMDKVITDKRDGYDYDFFAMAASERITVLGKSY